MCDFATRFESVEKTLSEERAKIDGQRAGEKEDANKQSTQTLTIRSLKRREAIDGREAKDARAERGQRRLSREGQKTVKWREAKDAGEERGKRWTSVKRQKTHARSG